MQEYKDGTTGPIGPMEEIAKAAFGDPETVAIHIGTRDELILKKIRLADKMRLRSSSGLSTKKVRDEMQEIRDRLKDLEDKAGPLHSIIRRPSLDELDKYR